VRFDGDEVLEALEPPSLKLGGRVYTGRILSLFEFLPFEERLKEASEKGWNSREYSQVVLRFCRLALAAEARGRVGSGLPGGVRR